MNNTLSKKEISLIKGIMKYYPEFNNQTILNLFSVSERTVNAGRISEIKTGKKHKETKPAPEKEVEDFVSGKVTVHYYLNQFPLGGDMFLFGDIKYSPANMTILIDENKSIEFKEKYEQDKGVVYLKTLAAMANAGSKNGKIIFGVKDNKEIVGCSVSIDKAQLSNLCCSYFEPFFEIFCSSTTCGNNTLQSMGFNGDNLPQLPIICKKNFHEKDNKLIMSDGQIFFRYGSTTRQIHHAELKNIMNNGLPPPHTDR